MVINGYWYTDLDRIEIALHHTNSNKISTMNKKIIQVVFPIVSRRHDFIEFAMVLVLNSADKHSLSWKNLTDNLGPLLHTLDILLVHENRYHLERPVIRSWLV